MVQTGMETSRILWLPLKKPGTFLGYSPKYNFTEGLRMAVEWYKNNLVFTEVDAEMDLT